MNNPEVIIGTCIYNRTWTIRPYLESIFKSTLNKKRFHIYLIINYDQHFTKDKACKAVRDELDDVSLNSPGITPQLIEENVDALVTPNLGLMGFNIPLEIGKTLNNTPVMLCNDDVIFGDNWTEYLLNTNITEANLLGNVEKIRPETIGFIGPCYINPGGMLVQKYNSNEKGYKWNDFLIGHSMLCTKVALEAEFRFESKLCKPFGAFDIYASMWACGHKLNSLISRDVCFTFPEDQESHFSDGDEKKFEFLGENWKIMQKQIEAYQATYKKPDGSYDWYFK